MTAHRGIEDPAAVEGTDIDKERAFNAAFRYMRNRIAAFIALPLKSIDALSLRAKLREIGRLDGATDAGIGVIRMMTTSATALRAGPLAPGDFRRLVDWLDAEGLPSGDLGEAGVRLFAFQEGDTAIGYAGLEIYGTPTRCCVPWSSIRRGVAPGSGRSIVGATLAEARRLGATRVFLLTNTARTYFERLGFAAIDRASAPETILSTRQAAGLCPSSAPLMIKALA